MDESKMPELPEPIGLADQWANGVKGAGYTADHMTAYAIQAAIRAAEHMQSQIAALEADAQRSLEERLQMAVDQARLEDRVREMALPKSYGGGTCVTDKEGGASVRLYFASDKEAHAWFGRLAKKWEADTALNGGATPGQGGA